MEYDSNYITRIKYAIFYGVSSYLLGITTKIILSEYKFPMIMTLIFLQNLSILFCSFAMIFANTEQSFVRVQIFKTIPCAILNFLNIISGVNSTRNLSLPMLTVLRRFSLFITLIGEFIFLKIRPKNITVFSIMVMILGAIIACLNDISFNANTYFIVGLNNLLTSGYVIGIKKILQEVFR
ncbi:hypothetical protein HZS_3929 [Henneguya salminicola]|nr:hypothetical protein HZS_3929 [Henneguya salminicola]